MHELDDSFRRAKAARDARRRKARRGRGLLVGVIACIIFAVAIVVATLLWGPIRFGIPGSKGTAESGADTLVAEPDVFVPALVDLPGNPLRISRGDEVGAHVVRTVERPDTVAEERAGGQLVLLTDVMVTTSEQFMTTLPSSTRDFEFYQAQRGSPVIEQVAYQPQSSVPTGTETDIVDNGAGWGESLGGEDGVESVKPTAVENTTSVAVVRPESERFAPTGEFKARIVVDGPLDQFIIENGFSVVDAPLFGRAMLRLLQRDGLRAGDVVAIRGVRPSQQATRLRPVALSLYSDGKYVGTLARSDAGVVVKGTDPWVYEELFNYVGEQQVAEKGRQYRLLDAIYSTAIRNQVPTGILGEAIMLLSRSFDLDGFASTGDRLLLAYAKPGLIDAGGEGRVLYVGVRGPDRDLRCYVLKAPGDSTYACFNQRGSGHSIVPGGMFTPVRGTLTSTFGPRKHPIFKQVKPHTGVDWAAPSGTQVSAAFDGTVSSAGNGGGYGNLLKIKHPDGRETYYAHLQAFAAGIGPGTVVKAGDVIGFVGTTGNSTGPHLHFEIRVGGTPIDPLQTVVADIADAGSEVADGFAVQDLTERIVKVESGGDPNAKNRKSTATGAGQFIQSTWLRMMRTYRRDLYSSMSEAELLALRTDPTIAREMVANLAREGEAFLKARGHRITTGRLYLCHFLGMQDAHVVLSASGSTALADLLAPGVIAANGFLAGHDAAWVINWAEKKMNEHYTPPVRQASVTPEAPAEFVSYKTAIDGLLSL